MSPGAAGATWASALGVHPGDTILLMADVTRMAWAGHRAGRRFNAAAFLDEFVQAVAPGGNVLVPTYNYDLRPGDSFDVRRTRSISGALAQAALAHPDFRRTPHPLHSFAVAGADAGRIVSTGQAGSFDDRSPFAFLLEKKATLIALDLPLDDALTFVHFVERREGVPYRKMRRIAIHYTDADGKCSVCHPEIFAKRKGHVNAFGPLGELLRKAGALVEEQAHGANVLRLDFALAYPVIAADIRLNRARSIHYFSARTWCADVLKPVLHTLGLRTAKERLAHAARTS